MLAGFFIAQICFQQNEQFNGDLCQCQYHKNSQHLSMDLNQMNIKKT